MSPNSPINAPNFPPSIVHHEQAQRHQPNTVDPESFVAMELRSEGSCHDSLSVNSGEAAAMLRSNNSQAAEEVHFDLDDEAHLDDPESFLGSAILTSGDGGALILSTQVISTTPALLEPQSSPVVDPSEQNSDDGNVVDESATKNEGDMVSPLTTVNTIGLASIPQTTDIKKPGEDAVKQDPPSTKTPGSPRFVRSNTTNSAASAGQTTGLPAALSRALTNLAPRPPTKAPKDALKAVYAAGEYKAGLTLDLLFVQAFMAGFFIGMAGHLFISVNGGLLGAVLFPTGLIAVILTSAELFTGDSLVFVASWLGGRVSHKSLLRNWTVSWIGNFCGCLMWAYFLSYLSGALDDYQDFAIKVALKKADQAWGSIFLKGVGANFMVCMAVWQATCAEEVAGKILALWFPVSGFVLMGFDHVVANQYLIPIGMLYGADVSTFHLFFRALLPATLGNLLGGGLGVGAVYWYVFDSMNHHLHVIRRIPRAVHNARSFMARTPSHPSLVASRQTSFATKEQTSGHAPMTSKATGTTLVQRRNQQQQRQQDLPDEEQYDDALQDVELGVQ